ncbi:MAG: TetR/AcrR family transcriptional regulator [Clostridiales Family XIII bacterium]|jgi:AcrR family transcriptional regulator|nr:TetR/AcrR family transcriptional regulator [Clostridiales Family XIII bacterium]
MNGYEKRTDKKKRAIISAARELFSERGVARVGISEIAKSAGVSQVSIYNYFGDKNSLASEAFVSYIEEAISEFEKIIRSDLPFSDKLGRIMQSKNDIAETVAPHFHEQAWEDKTLHQIFQGAVKERATRLYYEFIEAGKRDGAIDSDIPTEAIMAYLMASMSILQQPDFHKEGSGYKKGVRGLFLYGLLGKPDRR